MSILTYLWMYQSDDDIENSMPSNIFVTDGDTDTLTQLRANVEQHCLPAATGRSTISCYQLLWGTETTKQFQRQQQRNEDNKDDQSSAYFDVLLASDIVYVAEVGNGGFIAEKITHKPIRNGVLFQTRSARDD